MNPEERQLQKLCQSVVAEEETEARHICDIPARKRPGNRPLKLHGFRYSSYTHDTTWDKF